VMLVAGLEILGSPGSIDVGISLPHHEKHHDDAYSYRRQAVWRHLLCRSFKGADVQYAVPRWCYSTEQSAEAGIFY